MRVLVTGAAGFIGSHLVDRLLAEGFSVVGVDDLSTGRIENVAHNQGNRAFEFIRGDICDTALDKRIVKDVEAVFHEAALVSVSRSVEDPILANRINVDGTLALLSACLDSGVKRFIYASTCAVYGDATSLPAEESQLPNPISPYAASKLAAENYCAAFHRVYGLETVSLRYFNVYGPRQGYGPYSGVITIFVNRALKGEHPIIHGDGEQSRDFISVGDVAEANMSALNAQGVGGEVFNVATGHPTTINELARAVLKVTGKGGLRPVHVEPRPGDIRYSYGSTEKAERRLNFRAKVDLMQGLRETVDWFAKSSG